MKFYILEVIKILAILWVVLGVGNIILAFVNNGPEFGTLALVINMVCYFLPGAVIWFIADRTNK